MSDQIENTDNAISTGLIYKVFNHITRPMNKTVVYVNKVMRCNYQPVPQS
jgi:hypothetical protein